jgi:hypothetical protein
MPAILGLLRRQALPIGLAAAIAITALTAWHFRTQRDAARTDAAMASRTAEANAAALAQATAEHARQIAALAGEAERALAQAVRLGTNLEALRRDPSHATIAAPVLRDAVERLRAGRAAGDPAGAAPPP